MIKVTPINPKEVSPLPPEELLQGKRHLNAKEIYTLIQNRNVSRDPDWQNIYVSDVEGEFCVDQIRECSFSGWVVIGRLIPATLKFHDLELMTGLNNSYISNVSIGDDCVISNVRYLENYRLGNRVMLFNIQEMSCTLHSKFGEGLLKEGEPESNRIWIGAGNENGERSVLPFKNMICADAFLWSRYREDKDLMSSFVRLTEYGKSKKNNTYGTVGNDAVIKNCTLLKDAEVGECAYIKGAFKLKNISILSSPDEPSQIGEGVELVNGIMGYGSRIFYQAVAIRFVIGRNCQLKYGARLLNSVLGDNSTVSCCELLNNLIFPFHEQHHNSSFLIASTVMGQSNIASNATIGSNHNSRSPDGEMLAGRGFWPGLCSDFKFDSRFASFTLVAKGSYRNELNITYPFALVATGVKEDAIHIIPAYWFLYNMFAIVRNKYKFLLRDKRVNKIQHIETNPLAPDTVQEIMLAMDRLAELTGRYLKSEVEEMKKNTKKGDLKELELWRKKALEAKSEKEVTELSRDFLNNAGDFSFLLYDDRCQKKYGAVIYKPLQGYREYKRVLLYFAVNSLIEWADSSKVEKLGSEEISKIMKESLYTSWINAGGQIISCEKIEELFSKIKSGVFKSWEEVHLFYDECQKNYVSYKARYALSILEKLYSKPLTEFSSEMLEEVCVQVKAVSDEMYNSSVSSREKDYTDFFRSITFRNEKEKEAVLGKLQDNSFLKNLEEDTRAFNEKLQLLFSQLNNA